MSSSSSQFRARLRRRFKKNGSIRREVVSSWQTRKSEAEGRKPVPEKVDGVAEYSRIRRLIYLYTKRGLACARILHIPYLTQVTFIDSLSLSLFRERNQTLSKHSGIVWESSVSNLSISLFIFSPVFISSFRRFPVFFQSLINAFYRKFATLKG